MPISDEDDSKTNVKASPLLKDHEALGARFMQFGDAMVAKDYGVEVNEKLPLDHPLMTDLSFQGTIRVSGDDSTAFLTTMTTADIAGMSSIGSASWGLILNGEGQIIDIAYIVRTGDSEWMLLLDAPVVDEVMEWLTAFAQLGEDGTFHKPDEDCQRVFDNISIEDESGQLGIMCMMGPGCADLLDELIEDPGKVSNALSQSKVAYLDELEGAPMMLISDRDTENSIIIYTPRPALVAIWRSFLGYEEIQVVGLDQYEKIRRACGLWLDEVDTGRYKTPAEAGLTHLLRQSGGFVGFQGH